VERVLANIDASYGDCGVEFRRHSVLFVFAVYIIVLSSMVLVIAH
jgi:hypothetical protein